MARRLKPAPSGAYALKTRYCAMWRALQSMAQTGGANPEDSIVAEAKGSVIVIGTPETCLELRAVPARSSHDIKVVDVHVAFSQTIRTSNPPVIEKSNVKITYLGAKGGGASTKVLETWHFDYSPGTSAHPVHHAQLTKDHIVDGPTQRDYEVPHRAPDLRDAPRVPCAPIDLPALAAMLIYDHFPERSEQLDDEDWTRAASLPRFAAAHFMQAGLGRLPEARDWYPAARS